MMGEENQMTTIAILPENPGSPATSYRAVAGKLESVGRTAGEALDGLMAQLDETTTGTLAVVQQLRPDRFFTAEHQKRLGELMKRWRAARDQGHRLAPAEQAELQMLVEAELKASAARAAAMLDGLHA
jgi:hypothetical protein